MSSICGIYWEMLQLLCEYIGVKDGSIRKAYGSPWLHTRWSGRSSAGFFACMFCLEASSETATTQSVLKVSRVRFVMSVTVVICSPVGSCQKDASFTFLHDLFPAKVLNFFFHLKKVMGKFETSNLVLYERILFSWYILQWGDKHDLLLKTYSFEFPSKSGACRWRGE